MAIPRKGLSNIRTLSGRVDQVAVPYRAYMQITCLEMEKARRGAERRSAGARMAALDARLREIEQEKAALLAAVEHPEKRPAGLARRGAGRFRLRY